MFFLLKTVSTSHQQIDNAYKESLVDRPINKLAVERHQKPSAVMVWAQLEHNFKKAI